MGDVIVTGAHNRAYACAEYCRMNNLPQLEEVFQECHDKIVELKEKILEYERQDDWLPVDYTQAEYGKGCFDGQIYILFSFTGKMYFLYWNKNFKTWTNSEFSIDEFRGHDYIFTHYRPIPAGWIGG